MASRTVSRSRPFGSLGLPTVAGPPPTDGVVIYKKDWNDGNVNDGFWGFQNPNAVHTGNVVADNTVSGSGAYSGRFDIPADTGSRQAAEMLGKSGNAGGGSFPDAQRFAIPPNVDDYYFGEFRIDSYDIPDAEICQFNYESINGPPCALHISTYTGLTTQAADKAHMSLCILVNAGENAQTGIYSGNSKIPYYSGLPQGGGFAAHGMPAGLSGPWYMKAVNTMDLNTWYQWVIHIKWTADLNGVVEGWIRTRGETTWQQPVSKSGAFPTAQYGWSFDGTSYTNASSLTSYGSTDKFGCYRAPASTSIHVYHDNWGRATGFGAAAAELS